MIINNRSQGVEVQVIDSERVVTTYLGTLTCDLLEFLQKNKVSISTSCGGMGTCGACKVTVLNSENLSPKSELEIEIAEDRGWDKSCRLACQIEEFHKITIQI